MIIEAVTDESIIDHISGGPEKYNTIDDSKESNHNYGIKFDRKFINDTISTLTMMLQSKFPELKQVVIFKYPDDYLFDKYYNSNNTESGIGIGHINDDENDIIITNKIKTFIAACVEYIVDGNKVPVNIELRPIPETTIDVMVLLYDSNAEKSVQEEPLV